MRLGKFARRLLSERWPFLVVCLFVILLGLPVGSCIASSLPESEFPRFSQASGNNYNPCEGSGRINNGNGNGGGGCVAPTGDQITWIGDSYSVGAQDIIEKEFPGITFGGSVNDDNSYIQECKNVALDTECRANPKLNPSGIKILKKVIKDKKLKPYLVFALGTNRGWALDDAVKNFKKLGDSLGNTKVIFVTSKIPDNDFAESNEALKKLVESSDNYYLADWAEVEKDEWFEGDSTKLHPVSGDGYKVWVETIKDAIPNDCSDTSVADNQNYNGDTVWTDEQLKAIKANRKIYEKAEKETGVPWQAIATMHSLETGLARYNPENGQGVYQLYTYTDGGKNSNAFLPAGPISEEEFEKQTLIAAKVMKQMIESRNLKLDSDNGIKSLLFQYNGTAQEYIDKAIAMGFSQEEANVGEGSPYVMNRYDARRDPNSSKMDPHWPGSFVGDGTYSETATMSVFGGFVKYIALTGSGGYSDSSNSSSDSTSDICPSGAGGGRWAGSMDLNKSAIELAWPESESSKSYIKPTPAYVSAMKSTGIWAEADTNNDGIWDWAPRSMGMSCDMFVGTVVRYSGVDKDFPYALGGQKDYLANSDEWAELHITDSSQYKPGDIRIEYDGGHISMVVEVDGELKIASGSAFERFGDIGSFYMNGNLTYRKKGNEKNKGTTKK